MNTTDIETILVEYVRKNLSPTESERADISRRYEQLKDFLDERTFQSGSYARFTSSTPVNDLDVIYVLPDEVLKSIRVQEARIDLGELDIEKIIESAAKQLHEFYGSSATIKPQPHSIGIYFGTEEDFSIDVVPAIPADQNMFWVPESAHLSIASRRKLYASGSFRPSPDWIKSDPKWYLEQAKKIDEDSAGRFRKAAKSIKKWRWRCKKENPKFPLKSFHMELAIMEIFRQNQKATCLAAINELLDNLPTLIKEPKFRDHADPNRFVDEYVSALSSQERQFVMDQFHASLNEVLSIMHSNSPANANLALDTFFGMTYPISARSTTTGATSETDVPSKSVLKKDNLTLKGLVATSKREPGEQFLSDINISPDLKYNLKINATVSQDGYRPFNLLHNLFPLKKYKKLEFYIEQCSVPKPYEIKWKVKNTGIEAKREGDLRGQIYDDEGRGRRIEKTRYWGNHYVECYIIKNGVCVAADHIEVDISRN